MKEGLWTWCTSSFHIRRHEWETHKTVWVKCAHLSVCFQSQCVHSYPTGKVSECMERGFGPVGLSNPKGCLNPKGYTTLKIL